MKVVIINKSDSTGGAAVVSYRLMMALRARGVDAQMLVAEKKTDSTFVHLAAAPRRLMIPFLAERFKIFLANGLNRDSLFKIDTASDGINLCRNKIVVDADVICLNWVNQGLLSFKDLRRLAALGKPIVWTMHDMWNLTGVCHHAGDCSHYLQVCGNCPLLGKKAAKKDISFKTWRRKNKLYSLLRGRRNAFSFVAVSNWLAEKARVSSLLAPAPERPRVHVIPNAFPIRDCRPAKKPDLSEIKIIFGAARLDDSVKGLPILVRASEILAEDYPQLAARLYLITFGGVKNPDSIAHFAIKHSHLGLIHGAENVMKIYEDGHIVVSTSLFETLPGTLVEGQAYGCVPVSFNRGGQADIVSHLSTGYLAEWDDCVDVAARRIAEGIVWAAEALQRDSDILERMQKSVRERFSEEAVADAYICLFNSLLNP